MNEISQIDGHLWLGAYPPPEGYPQFRYIFNLDASRPYTIYPGQLLFSTPLIDGPEIPPVDVLYDLAALVELASMRGPTLVHCAAGLNRSGLVMGLTLVDHRDMTPHQAIKLMRDRRSPSVLCNPEFERWLNSKGETWRNSIQQ
jgi:protein-tyrosine phosphatase